MSDSTTDDGWTVIDHSNDGNARTFDSRSDAEAAVETCRDLGGDPELVAPGESPGDDADDTDDADAPACGICGDPVHDIENSETDVVGQAVHTECWESNVPDPQADGGTAEVVEVDDPAPEPEVDVSERADELPERSVADDPLTWMPGDFVDQIDGSAAINRKGFEVLSHFYDIDVTVDLQVAPDETGHEYARVKATATTGDGRTCEAFGSAHVDRGDDEVLLLEMAGTRARKRALSIASGVGAVAVEELKSEVDR